MGTFTLRQLEHFLAAADEGSISAAARRLHVSPGGISLAISELEAILGVQLMLRRRAKGVALTPTGRLAADRARSVLRESGELQDIARLARGELAGTLRIGCFTTLSPWLMPRIIAHFMAKYPGVRVEMVEGSSDVLQQQLADGEIDACLMYLTHVRPGVDCERTVPVRLQIILSADHRLAGRKEVGFRELSDEPAIVLALRPTTDLVENMLKAAGFEPNVRWTSSNVETIRSMVARGIGYSVIMGRPVGDRTYDGLELVYKRISDEVPENAVVVAYAKGTTPSAKVRTLIDFCRHEFGDEGHPVQ